MNYYIPDKHLCHHGIKGMRWGIRRYQKKDGSLTSAGKKRYSEDSRPENEAIDRSKKKGLTKGQKTTLIIGASVVGVALASYGGYRLAKSGKLDKFIDAGKQAIGRSKDMTVQGLFDNTPIGGIKKLSKPESVIEAISKANPTKSHTNCYNCVVTTVARLCGFDVSAKGDTVGGIGMKFDDLCKAMGLNPDNETQVRRIMNPSVDRIANVISKRYKDGDCGAIGFNWNNTYAKAAGVTSAGHTLNWIFKDGKVEFMDGQVGISGDRLRNYLANYLDSGKEASIARFANVLEGWNIDPDIINRFAN